MLICLAPRASRVYRCGKCKKFLTFEKPLFRACLFDSLDENTYACETIIKAPPPPAYLAMEVRSLAYHNIQLDSEPDKPCLAPKSMLKRFRYVNRKGAVEFAKRECISDMFYYFGVASHTNSNHREIQNILQTRIAPICEKRYQEIVRKMHERRKRLSAKKQKGDNCAIS